MSHKPSPAVIPAVSESTDLSDRLANVNRRIAQACANVGRSPDTVRLLPVSKTVSIDQLRHAVALGIERFGENRVQEAMHKAEAMRDLNVQWSIIGHLQTNKAKYVARFAAEVQSLDSLKLARRLDRELQIQGRSLDVMVQVNSSGESSKYGLPTSDVAGFFRELSAYDTLRPRGLMTLAVFSDKVSRVRDCFSCMRALRDELRQSMPDPDWFSELSMGMSSDYTIAIEEGSTIVRVGQALFGPRDTPDSVYWPGA